MTDAHTNLAATAHDRPYDERGAEPRAAGDAARPRGSVLKAATGEWVVLGHAEALQVVQDAETFSSAVSRFLQVPNGLDGAEHAAFREALDPYLTAEELQWFEPQLREIAAQLCRELAAQESEGQGVRVDAVTQLGSRFAVRGQCRWLGWPADLEQRLLDWMVDNHQATRSAQLEHTARVAHEFDDIIASVVRPRRGDRGPGDVMAGAPRDVTTALLQQRVRTPEAPDGRPMTDEEVISVLRNWTGGDLGSIALCTGVLLHFFAQHPQLQQQVRAGMDAEALSRLIDEVLRIDDPFVANRRVATCPVSVGEATMQAGDRVRIHWTSVNRDERVFPDPDAFDPEGNAEHNIVYGEGPHICPGRHLATMELRIMVEEVLAAFDVEPAGDTEREKSPVGGFASVPLRLTRR